ncbi:FAD binding domain-containing protein [Salinactinospora qingdaonensis]|uniref:Xanthine dehydrogenase family protein subunit M n=1 Tax=Salinactinospora qingdaonensis TaxID=702744 RepID=A0ABP7FF64_9ACTN
MIPASFDYVRAQSVEEAVTLLGRTEQATLPLAGGQSLLPLLRHRSITPSTLVDLGRLPELRGIEVVGDHVVIGALTRYRELETSHLLAEEAPLLRHVAGLVGDPQMRHRGTIGGALAHADPCADIPATAVALDASVVLHGEAGRREVAVEQFLTGPGRTVRSPEEVLVQVRLPRAGGRPWAYQRSCARALAWPTVAVAVAGDRVAMAGMGDVPWPAPATRAALGESASAAEAAALADEGAHPRDDRVASARYRRHLARILTRRALEEAGR